MANKFKHFYTGRLCRSRYPACFFIVPELLLSSSPPKLDGFA